MIIANNKKYVQRLRLIKVSFSCDIEIFRLFGYLRIANCHYILVILTLEYFIHMPNRCRGHTTTLSEPDGKDGRAAAL